MLKRWWSSRPGVRTLLPVFHKGSTVRSPSERVAERQLDLAVVDLGGRDHAEIRGTHRCAGNIEQRVVGQVEYLEAKLQVVLLVNSEFLEQREIPVYYARPDDRIAAGIAEAEAGAWQAVDEGGGIEPVAGILQAASQVRVAPSKCASGGLPQMRFAGSARKRTVL